MSDAARIPLTAYQRDIWVSARRAPRSPQFNCVLHERLEGRVDRDLLIACTERVLRGHDAFRLSIHERDGVPSQRADQEPVRVRVRDFSDVGDPAGECAAWMERSLERPLDVENGPLMEATLLVENSAPGTAVVHLHLKAHHLVTDGWTVNQLSRQILADYGRSAHGGDGRHAGVNESSYLGWASTEEARYRDGADHGRDAAFHREALAGVMPALFTRNPAALAGERRRVRRSFTVDADQVERMRDAGFSPFAYIAAMLGLYLSRVHRDGETVIGVPFLNRPDAHQRDIAGQFANTLPLRVPSDGGHSVRDRVSAVQDAVRALRPHARLALGDILRGLPSPAAASGPRRLFDVTLSHLRCARPAPLPGLLRHTTMLAPGHDADALAVSVQDFDDVPGLRVDLDGAGDVFDGDFPLQAAVGHLKTLIANGLDALDGPASAVEMLSPAERDDLVLVRGRGPEVAFDEEATLHGLFEAQVARRGEQVAVTGASGQTVTYAELNARANRLARGLREKGVGADDRVAVVMERSPELFVALLGVLKAGGAYVPVDPRHPAERVRFLLDDSGAKAVIVDGGTPLADALDDSRVWSVEDLLRGSGAALEPVAGSRDLAYVIYTSGSTGRPKGVMVEHRSVVNRLAWMQRCHPLTAGDVLLQKTPVSFDVSVWELFWWAVEGVSVALLPPGGERDPQEILRTIRQQRVSEVHFVPSMLGPFLDLLEESPHLVDGLGSLRHVFCSGEALPVARVRQFHRVFGGAAAARLVNLYGPTEATVDVSHHTCAADPGRPVSRVPIGRPIDNIQLYVLDPSGRPQPVGAPGELCVGGVGVARGYLGRAELTAEKFTDDPFTPGGKLYRTGDLARWLADGSLEYLGRIDTQVKIRGNRVEPGEVAEALAGIDEVGDALVVDHTTAERGTHLIGYYTAPARIPSVTLRQSLARTLPTYMIPARFLRIDRIPLTPNGKADRRALPVPDADETGSCERSGELPRDAAEGTLAEIWARVLGREHVGIHDDYFALGGDSILMLKIRAQAEKRGLRFSLTDLFQHPTVAELATRAERHEGEDGEPEPAPFALIPQEDRARLTAAVDAFPLTRLQLGLIYHSREHESTARYKDVFQYSLELPWNQEAFGEAYERLVARHPVLRSSVDLSTYTEPLQIIHPDPSGGLEIADLRALTAEDAEKEIRRHVESRRRHPYPLDGSPLYLLRAHVRPAGIELVLSFHHALLDGGSVANLLQELLQDYAHAIGLDTEPVPAVPLPSPAAYVRAEQRALADDEARRHFQERLADCEPPVLPGFGPHQPPRERAADLRCDPVVHRADVPEALHVRLRALAAEHALPIKSLLFAAHCLTLGALSGTHDVTTGLLTHGRVERAHAERTAGLFLNTVPLRLDTAGASWLEVAREALGRERESHPHRRHPLSAVEEQQGSPVLNSAFNYVHFHQLADVTRIPGLALRAVRTWEETNFPLLVNAVTEPDATRMWLRIDGDGTTVGREQAELYADHFLKILARLADDVHGEPDFTHLAHPSRQSTATATAHPTVVERFAAQTARSPQAIALKRGEEQWSYARLDREACLVAGHLRALGMPAQARIAVAMDRSPHTIAVLLGVLRAGGAVVPLDTGYPAGRLAAMLEQTRPFRVIATSPHAHLAPGAILLPAEQLTAPHPESTAPNPRTGAAEPWTADPEHTAYVLFTSGSTGRPKGVAMPHRALANLVAWQLDAASGAVGGTTLQYAPMSFDVSFQEIFSTLCGGGTLHLVGEAERQDMSALLRLMDRGNVERVFLPYVALQHLAETSDALGIVPRALRVLISSGEQLRVTPEIRRLCAALPGALLENQYGPTETHVATAFTMSGDPATFPALPPIGGPIDGTEVHVLDARLRPAPIGARGEIYLGGACLAQGYEGRPELTDERFVSHPASGRRLYRTGDLGLVLPDGDIVCVGRTDDQVKVRGFRVEPAEVELAISEAAADHFPLRQVAVIAERRESGDCALAAFLVGDADGVDLDVLRTRLRAALPDHMVPAHLRWVAQLPLTPSGKRDDAALRRVPLLAPTAVETRPRDTYERELTELLADLLGLPAVGVHDSLFERGGTSLTAMRLVVKIEQRYRVNIPLATLVAEPTAAALAARLRSGPATTAFSPLVPIRETGESSARPPLFVVHPMGGNVLCYLPFARHLPDDQPLYALQAVGIEAGTTPVTSVQEMARGYISALRTVRPQGPYHLAGWSFGGFVAYEMARQLQEAGEEVSQILLLDTTALRRGPRRRHDEEALLHWFFWELLWLERGSECPQPEFPVHLTTLPEKLEFIAGAARDAGVLPNGSSQATVRRLFDLYRANWQAALDYWPRGLRCDLTLIRAMEPMPQVLAAMHRTAGSRHQDRANGWGGLTDGLLRVIDVPGDHLTIMEEPNVKHLAQTVNELLTGRFTTQAG
ncbi:amino acid adenylation domain-containing protein [Streptomyces aureoverticillatus]|uniref:amino acid adenylation domain-containing protein n=1 Tax=Streptomyces aureoverticillatus TaxID=66871 RepID=UPI0013DC3049|nr:non-ribosomal peptide synthetase [Streptomyces aureoverticillatus]QIB48238.1 amino acid adenylation domain-containing protein [Streptomyces aureoverticillatus]